MQVDFPEFKFFERVYNYEFILLTLTKEKNYVLLVT